MSTYAELDHIRKLARQLYLELRTLGLDLRAHEENPEDPTGYRIDLIGAKLLSLAHANKLRLRVEQTKPGLMRILLMLGKWGVNPSAISEEAGAA